VTAADAVRESLRPVEDGVLEWARRRAGAIADAAEEDARRMLAAAQADADRLIDQARRQGEEAGARTAAGELAAARSAARSLVLGARRRAFEELRRRVLDELARRGDTPEVRALSDRMTAVALARGGEPAVVRPGSHGLDIVAGAGRRRAVVTPGALVDRQLAALATEVGGLWA